METHTPAVISDLPDTQQSAGFVSAVKAVVDVTVSSALLVCSLPAMCIAALAIMCESPGSPIYCQDRVGINGKVFKLYKLRTMQPGAEKNGFTTAANDERVTAIGSYLRSSKLDELPQLFNILKREMTLIGPRPLSVDETQHLVEAEGFSPESPGLVPTVLPGLIGLEQCTRSSLAPYAHRFWLNDYYEKHRSTWLDLWIIKQTLLAYPFICAFAATSLIFAGTFIAILLLLN